MYLVAPLSGQSLNLSYRSFYSVDQYNIDLRVAVRCGFELQIQTYILKEKNTHTQCPKIYRGKGFNEGGGGIS